MGEGIRPTERQKCWLEGVLGTETWKELSGRADFALALETSLTQARRIALRYLAERERMHRVYGTE